MTITPLYAGLLALWFFVLSVRVIRGRGGPKGVSLGDGGDAGMLRVIRGHANFAEYVPFILLMMALLEFGGMRGWLLHAIGSTLVVARLLHGYALSFSDKFKFGRFYGTLLTFAVMITCAVFCVLQGLKGFQ